MPEGPERCAALDDNRPAIDETAALDVLLARGMMGDGHIDFAPISAAVDAAGYSGDIEVEIFNEAIWAADPVAVVERTVDAFAETVGLSAATGA